jgi:uncharacterized protein YkwD
MQVPNHYIQQDCIASSSVNTAKETLLLTAKQARRAAIRRALCHAITPAVLAISLLVQPVLAGSRSAQVLAGTGAPAASQYFGVTGKAVSGSFLQTFNRFGLQAIGYPLSDARQENGMTVQYFERVRMEYHPETAAKGFPVLMTRLGYALSKNSQGFSRVAAFKSSGTKAYIKETGHSISGSFLSFWKAKGGLELYGYPLSEPMMQGGLLVQWFERARFEYHPELAKAGQAVQLSLLGRDALQEAGALPAVPAAPPAQSKPEAPPAPSAPAPQSAQSDLSGMESFLLAKINEQRAAAGLGQVRLSSAVTNVARTRSNDMAERNYFSHTMPEGSNFLSILTDRSIGFKYAGEILARNNFPDDQAAEVAIDSYLNSPPHKAIIMDGRYNVVGVGYSKSGEDAMHYFTVIFVEQ